MQAPFQGSTSERTQPVDHVERSDETASQPVLSVRGLHVAYGQGEASTSVLRDVSLTIGANEFVSIVGASGCGKTTLLKVIAGLLPHAHGEVRLDGELVRGPSPREAAVVFQEDALLPWYRVEDNVALGLAAQGVKRRERRERVAAALEMVGLAGSAAAYPHELSGGMRQRVALARGLVMEPRLLLLDEPFAALDEQTRNLMGAQLRSLHARVGGAMVMVTHSLTEAVLLSDRVLALSAQPGRVRIEIDVPLGPHRSADLVGSSEFVAIRRRLWEELEDEWYRSLG